KGEEVVEEHEAAGGVPTADHVSGQTEERLGLDAGEGLPPALGRKGDLGMGTGPEGNCLLDALGTVVGEDLRLRGSEAADVAEHDRVPRGVRTPTEDIGVEVVDAG